MALKIAIASGKGGTGKTTVAVNLATVWSLKQQLILADCDVEEPNCHLFLPSPATSQITVNLKIPQINSEFCSHCGQCAKFCQFNALVAPGKNPPLVFPELCHGCGGCRLICPDDAISEVDFPVGTITVFKQPQLKLFEGRLKVSTTSAPLIIKQIKSMVDSELPLIIDSPPGASCAMVSAVKGVNLVVLVAEPTPFGFWDFKLAAETLKQLKQPTAVIINRVLDSASSGAEIYQQLKLYCQKNQLPLLAEIPDQLEIAQICSEGQLPVLKLPEYRIIFEQILNKLKQYDHEKEAE